jgi:hypothetical protein
MTIKMISIPSATIGFVSFRFLVAIVPADSAGTSSTLQNSPDFLRDNEDTSTTARHRLRLFYRPEPPVTVKAAQLKHPRHS